MRRQLVTGLAMTAVLIALLGVAYPLAVFGVGQGLFHRQAEGSLVAARGRVVGSALLGQRFLDRNGRPDPREFQPRPSAAGKDGDDPLASGASNLGPSNPRFLDTVSRRVDEYRRFNHLGPADAVPADAVTASGSGLDPDISVANARLQARRVAAARGLPLSEVLRLVEAHTHDRPWGFLGEKVVPVLELNLALDRLRP